MSRLGFYLLIVVMALALPLMGLLLFKDELYLYIPAFLASPETTTVLPPIRLSDSSKPRGEFHTVLIRAAGFDPSRLTIKAGDIVKWINMDSELHWPASDPHPTHTGVSPFDSTGDLGPGEVYAYLFGTPGIFVYHDHSQALRGLTSTITGLIRVE